MFKSPSTKSPSYKGYHRHWGSGYMVSVGRVITQNHLIKESWDFIDGFISRQATILLSMMVRNIVEVDTVKPVFSVHAI